MANRKHLKILRQGVDAWNKWREKKPGIIPELTDATLIQANLFQANLNGANLFEANLNGANLNGADLARANLYGADLIRANLKGADLTGADLNGADLAHANLSRADLAHANLSRADLTDATLIEANLTGANLKGAYLKGADLTEANLTKAFLYETIFGNTNLSIVNNLDSCVHHGPSIIDHRTLMKSGNLPEVFLRGCGLPDFIIENISVLREDPIQYYSCFISYSSKDQEFAERLYADLQNNGVRCWYAPHDLKGGKKIYDQINQAIRIYDKLLLILSENSINSDWVELEIKAARKKEKEQDRQMLFPITLINHEDLKKWDLFDAATVTNLADEVREYYIPDFSNWKDHDSYKESFARILRDLKGES